MALIGACLRFGFYTVRMKWAAWRLSRMGVRVNVT